MIQTLDELLTFAAAHKIRVIEYEFQGILAIALPDGTIGIDRTKCDSDDEYRNTLAHEVGHIMTRSFYRYGDSDEVRAACEAQADEWAAAHVAGYRPPAAA